MQTRKIGDMEFTSGKTPGGRTVYKINGQRVTKAEYGQSLAMAGMALADWREAKTAGPELARRVAQRVNKWGA